MSQPAATLQRSIEEPGALSHVREGIARFTEMNSKLGGLFTQAQAALLIGVSKQRVASICKDGRLSVHEFTVDLGDGPELVGRYISGHQIERFLASERKPTGRPSKLQMTAAAFDNK